MTAVGAAPCGLAGFVSDGPVSGVLVPFWCGLSLPFGWPVGFLPGFSFRQPDGTVWTNTYDARGNLLTQTTPDGGHTSFSYRTDGAVLTATDAVDATTRYTCDTAGLPLTATDPLGGMTSCTRDAFGRPTSITDPTGATTIMAWTTEGKPSTRTAPDGSVEAWKWDGEGNCLTHTDPIGGQTHYSYGHFDLPTSRTTPDGVTYHFAYDTELRLTQVTTPTDLTWTYTYDVAGRLTGETDFDGRTVTYTLDPVGNLTSRTTPVGDTLDYEHDSRGRTTAKHTSDGTTAYTYDPLGRLLTATSPTTALLLSYDALGRPLSETVDGRTTTYTYDPAGRRTTRATPSGTTSTYLYDPAGNRTHLTAGLAPGRDGHTLAFTHDPAGREITQHLAGARLDFSWDTVGRLTRQTLSSLNAGADTALTRANDAAHVLRDREYSYRPDGFPTGWIDHSTGTARTVELDPVGRPLAVTGANWSEHYAYDAHGNQTHGAWPPLTAAEGSSDQPAIGERSHAGTRIQAAGRVAYRHDDAGRLIERRIKRLSRKPDIWRYTWDAEDRLTACITPDGTRWTYAYDPLGRRIAKQRHAPDDSIAQTTYFAWDGTRLAEEHDTATATTRTWDHDGHRPLAQHETRHLSQDEVDTRFYALVTDLVGTPTDFVDETGSLAATATTTTWGTTSWQSHTADQPATPLRFPGQYADAETGLNYNYFRHYDPATSTYCSPDPLGLAPHPSPAQYVTNPFTACDPCGLAPYVYRNLRPDEDPDKGLVAKNPNAKYTPAGHVMNGSHPSAASQFISTTNNIDVANQWASGRMVKIDLGKFDGEVVDLSTHEGRVNAGIIRGRPYNYAKASEELLLVGRVPPEAMTWVTGGPA